MTRGARWRISDTLQPEVFSSCPCIISVILASRRGTLTLPSGIRPPSCLNEQITERVLVIRQYATDSEHNSASSCRRPPVSPHRGSLDGGRLSGDAPPLRLLVLSSIFVKHGRCRAVCLCFTSHSRSLFVLIKYLMGSLSVCKD